MKRVRELAAVMACVALALVAQPAWADAPTRTAWWNAASANGMVLPQPTTAADDLHIAQGPSGPAAYAAVAYDLAGLPIVEATLELKVVPNSAVGTVVLMACPTKDTSWKAGGNQPYDAAPAYDCALGEPGPLSADGSKVSFFLGAPMGAGYSLAIVPAPDAAPFSVDLLKPDATSLAPVPAAPAVEPGPVTAAPPAPPVTSGVGAPPMSAALAPLAPTAGVQAPAVAVPARPAPQAAPAPAALAAASSRPAVPVSNRDRYAAGTMLALLAGLVVWLAQQPSRQPRLLGGMARKSGPVQAPIMDLKPRGIGRFSTLRTAPARPLV